MREAGLEPAETILEARQLGYTTRVHSLPGYHPAKQILLVTFREGDQHAQPGEQSLEDRVWAEPGSRSLWSLGQHLARQLAKILPVDPSGGFEESVRTLAGPFPGQIQILPTEEAIRAAQDRSPRAHSVVGWLTTRKWAYRRRNCVAEPPGNLANPGDPLGAREGGV